MNFHSFDQFIQLIIEIHYYCCFTTLYYIKNILQDCPVEMLVFKWIFVFFLKIMKLDQGSSYLVVDEQSNACTWRASVLILKNDEIVLE